MLRILLALCLLCVGVLCTQECGTLQRTMVKIQWGQYKENGRERIRFNLALWKRIFHDKPDAKQFFDRVKVDNIYSPDFKAHMNRVLSGLDMTISMLDDQSTLDALLAHLNTQHKDLGVGAEYFSVMEEAILDMASESIGSCFDFGAWNACLTHIMNGITA